MSELVNDNKGWKMPVTPATYSVMTVSDLDRTIEEKTNDIVEAQDELDRWITERTNALAAGLSE